MLVDQSKTVFVWGAGTDVHLAKADPPSGVLGSLASHGVLRDGDHAGTRTQAPPPELEPRYTPPPPPPPHFTLMPLSPVTPALPGSEMMGHEKHPDKHQISLVPKCSLSKRLAI